MISLFKLVLDYVHQLILLVKHWSSYFGLANRQNFEDTFYQLLHDKDYDEALKLAQQHDFLDIDLVYKCKWRNSGITVQSINSVLAKIQDKLWTINECVQTVPISFDACRRLLEFGLNESSLRLLYELGDDAPAREQQASEGGGHELQRFGFKKRRANQNVKKRQLLLGEDVSDDDIEAIVDFDNLNDQQKELCRCRQKLIRYEHSLHTYETILGDFKTVQQNFDHVFYDELRQKCPLNICVEYANDGDSHAVETCLNYYTDSLSPHILAILSNFPETLSPYQYRNLLPCLRENETVFQWRVLSSSAQVRLKDELDWSSRDKTSAKTSAFHISKAESYEEQFYNSNGHLRKYSKPLTSSLLSQWFVERALEIEQRTLLLSCAIQLLHLGSELNIKNLKETHDDLNEFDRIVYDCCTENNIYLSYAQFQQMPEIEKLLMMTGDSLKNCRDRFRFYVIPYLHRRDDRLGLDGKTNLLRDYFRRLAQAREQICRTIYNDLLDRIECDTFVAEWTKGMDDAIDEMGDEIKTIERERQAKQLSTMASQTFALGDFNECYEACQLIMRKNFKECWPICCQLGMHEQFENNEAKYKLLSFALAHCEDPDGKMSFKMLNYVIELRKRDQKIQLKYLKQNMM